MLSVPMAVGLVTPSLDVLHLLHSPGRTQQICYSRLQVKQQRQCKWSPWCMRFFSFQSQFSQSCRSSYHPACWLPCSTMMRFVVTTFSSSFCTDSSRVTILEIFHPGPPIFPRARYCHQLIPWYTTTIEHWANLPLKMQYQRNTSIPTKYLRWLLKIKCSKDTAMDKPNWLFRKSPHSNPQSHF